MKLLAMLSFATLSFSTFAANYECEFTGPNYILSIEENGQITLRNSFKNYSCENGYVNFPGTELELKVFNCKNGNEKRVFYYAQKDNGDYILSKDLGISKDIDCHKI